MKRISSVVSAFAVLLSLLYPPAARSAPAAAKTNPLPKLNLQEAPLARDVKAGTSFAPVIKKVAPSVVNIYSTMTVRDRQQTMNPLFDDPFFRRFFGDEFGEQQR